MNELFYNVWRICDIKSHVSSFSINNSLKIKKNYGRYELEQSREYKAAMDLENALNNTCFDYKMFAESVKYYHPTLQQNLFRLIREIINVQSDENRYYDARNKASHEVAKKLKSVVENECLPYI